MPLINDQPFSIVMISLNESLAIKKIVTQIRQDYPQAEIVVVDSSTDQTAEIAKALDCVVIKQFPPQGYGKAMDTALKNASCDIVITLDCDGTYPLSAIPDLITILSQGYDLVSASRLQKNQKQCRL